MLDSSNNDIAGDVSIHDLCVRFGELLGTGVPVPEHVMRVALQDDLYAHYLLSCRDTPQFLAHLIANPPIRPEIASSVDGSVVTLLVRATHALWRWGRAGFETSDDVTFQRRYNACRTCPNRMDAPGDLSYRLVLAGSDDNSVCRACGCAVVRKARLASESCPEEHPTIPGMTRWEEPI